MIVQDLLAASLVGFASIAIFASYVMSDPCFRAWLSLPGYLRLGLIWLGTIMLFRGADLVWLADQAPSVPGHVDSLALLGATANAFYFGTMAVSLFVTRFSPKLRDAMSELLPPGE